VSTESLPPQIPKRSLAPLWIGTGAVFLIVGALWGLLGSASKKSAAPDPASPATAATPAQASPAHVAPLAETPPPPPPPEHAPPPPPRVGSIPAGAPAAPLAPAAKAADVRRDPNCDDPCQGKETAELLGALRAKAGQARSCYERALSNNSALAGKLEVGVRVGANGAACAASVTNDTLGDAAVKSCAVARFRGAKYPKPTGGCLDISVPMNFMPGGSR